MATIREIAKACGVSISTVSNVLNNKSNVGEDTRQKILDTAKEMAYIPNYMAKNLKLKTTKTIGIITEDLTVFNCAEIVDGIHEFFDEHGYTFLLGNLRLYKKYDNEFYHRDVYKKQVDTELNKMKAKQVDGIIYIGAHCRKINYIPQGFPIPLVLAYSFCSNPDIPSVIFDDEEAAYQAGGGKIPVQLFKDFCENRPSHGPQEIEPQMKGGYTWGNVRAIFPEELAKAIEEGIHSFGKRLKGYDRPDALISGVESRTSSPVRILRDDTLQSKAEGLYPCGEGAGYAGGITSAAIDGLKVAQAIVEEYSPF